MRRPKNRLIGLLLVSILSFALFSPFAMAAPEEKIGIIILGHGDPTPEWAETIVEMTEYLLGLRGGVSSRIIN
jgi:hypothetical protein